MDLSLETAVRDGVTVITVSGYADVYTSSHLRAALRPAVAAGPVVLALDGCEFLDERGLGVIVGARKLALESGHDLAIACAGAGAGERVLKMFGVAGLTNVLTICDTVDLAVEALQDEKAGAL